MARFGNFLKRSSLRTLYFQLPSAFETETLLKIRPASPTDDATLTAIAHDAKRYWGYPENWIEHWKDDLTITPEFISANEVYVAGAEGPGEIDGFYALVMNGERAELEHMWVRPERIGSGIGKDLLVHAMETAAFLNAAALEISSDPNAEGFYKRMGAKRIGEISSEVEGQPRTLPRLSIDL